MRKIDVFNHILPEAYLQELEKLDVFLPLKNVIQLKDMDARVREVAAHDGLEQILTLVMPEVVDQTSLSDGRRLAALANDEMARVVTEYPKTFTAGVATVCLRDMAFTLKELRRAIEELGFRGVQIATTCADENLSEEKYLPFFEAMAAYDLPVLIHPCNGPNSKPDMIFNWPLETTWMMINLATSGIFERLPNLKLITHHLGAMTPAFHNRIFTAYLREGFYEKKPGSPDAETAHEDLKKFYNDTALYGDCTAAIENGIAFFGIDHVLFGTDAPLDGDRGSDGKGQTKNTIDSICRLSVSEADKAKIFSGNALRVFNLQKD